MVIIAEVHMVHTVNAQEVSGGYKDLGCESVPELSDINLNFKLNHNPKRHCGMKQLTVDCTLLQ